MIRMTAFLFFLSLKGLLDSGDTITRVIKLTIFALLLLFSRLVLSESIIRLISLIFNTESIGLVKNSRILSSFTNMYGLVNSPAQISLLKMLGFTT